MPPDEPSRASREAERYYDSDEADEFYREIWGGEDIHIGIYEPIDRPIVEASRATVARMASKLDRLGPDVSVIDIGAGYGGSARYLARQYGCPVTCLNISETQNEYNRRLNAEQGLAEKIRVLHGNFEEIPEPDDSYDVVWCQDSILHSGRRRQVLEEVRRIIKPRGRFVFTDPMQADSCPPDVLAPILERLNLPSLASPGFYRRELEALHFEEQEFEELTQHLRNHYDSVRKELQARYDEMIERGFQEYVDAMLTGLEHWVDGARKGYLVWGIFVFRAR